MPICKYTDIATYTDNGELALPVLDPFQVAVLRASSAFGDDVWNRLSLSERSSAICRELRRLDVEQVASRSGLVGRNGAAKTRAAVQQGAPQQDVASEISPDSSAATVDCDEGCQASTAGRRRVARQQAATLPASAKTSTKAYRIVIRSNQSGGRSYRWEIVNDNTDVVIRRSKALFRTMEQAYDHGTVELTALGCGSGA